METMKIIDIIEKQVDRKIQDQKARHESYTGKATLAITVQAMIVAAMVGIHLTEEGNTLKCIVTVVGIILAIFGVIIMINIAMRPRAIFEAPDVRKLIEKYGDMEMLSLDESDKKAMKLRKQILVAKQESYEENEKRDKRIPYLVLASNICIVFELVMLLMAILF